jgi:hypothetical protein
MPFRICSLGFFAGEFHLSRCGVVRERRTHPVMSLNSHTTPRLASARARDGGDRDTDQSNKQSGQTRTKLTFLVLTFEEGIPFVVANF